MGCQERGKLMADIWASQGDITARLMLRLKASNDAHQAMAHALLQKERAVDAACKQVHRMAIDAMEERDVLRERVAALQAELSRATERALDQ